jgi:hypothetical protein
MDGRRSKERIELSGRLFARIQRECPELLNFLLSNIKIMSLDDEQLVDRIRNQNLIPSFVRDELSRHAHGAEDISVLEKEICVYLCRRVRATASLPDITHSNTSNSEEKLDCSKHCCKFQVEDLEHCFVEILELSEDAGSLGHSIALLTAEDIERIIYEREQKKGSHVKEVDVCQSLSLIRSLCLNFGANFLEDDQPVLLIGNTGCGNIFSRDRFFFSADDV